MKAAMILQPTEFWRFATKLLIRKVKSSKNLANDSWMRSLLESQALVVLRRDVNEEVKLCLEYNLIKSVQSLQIFLHVVFHQFVYLYFIFTSLTCKQCLCARIRTAINFYYRVWLNFHKKKSTVYICHRYLHGTYASTVLFKYYVPISDDVLM